MDVCWSLYSISQAWKPKGTASFVKLTQVLSEGDRRWNGAGGWAEWDGWENGWALGSSAQGQGMETKSDLCVGP